jgi:hypothetical protein
MAAQPSADPTALLTLALSSPPADQPKHLYKAKLALKDQPHLISTIVGYILPYVGGEGGGLLTDWMVDVRISLFERARKGKEEEESVGLTRSLRFGHVVDHRARCLSICIARRGKGPAYVTCYLTEEKKERRSSSDFGFLLLSSRLPSPDQSAFNRSRRLPNYSSPLHRSLRTYSSKSSRPSTRSSSDTC